MATTDESENKLDHLSERIYPNGWRVISNSTRQPDPEANGLKTLIQLMQTGHQQKTSKHKFEGTEPPEAA